MDSLGPAGDELAGLEMVDAHCHPLPATPVPREGLAVALTEAEHMAPLVDPWDTMVGLAVRRWCGPVLGMEPGVTPDEYLQARAALGAEEATRRLLRAARLSYLLVDTGLAEPQPQHAAELAADAEAQWREVVRLERVAERVASSGVSAHQFAPTFLDVLATEVRDAVAVKSILAYRHGFDVDPARPSGREVNAAAAEWLAAPGTPPRLTHAVLLRFVLWSGLDLGLPVQLHCGFGDRDVPLARSDPALLQPLLTAAEPLRVPIVLLHCYPFHRQAAWLAQVYPHVYLDVGLTVAQVGARARAVLAECCELAPFGKLLFSTDGCRVPELFLVGAAQFRHSFGALLDGWVADGDLTVAYARRIARMVSADNARRVYGVN